MRQGPPRVFAGASPSGWTARGFDDNRWTAIAGLAVPRLPLPTAETQDRSTSVTQVDVPSGASMYFRQHFTVANPRAARVLEVRVTYLDGFVAYLNGAEIARRNLPTLANGARPPFPHGAEPERIFVPVSAATPLHAGDNVVAVEVRPAVGRFPVDSNGPAGALVDVAVFSRARLVRGPYLIAPVDGAVTVAWETDLPVSGGVQLQPAEAAPTDAAQSFAAGAPGLRQTVRLTGLRAGGRYRYRVGLTDRIEESPWATFEAAPAHEAPLRFVVYGDMRAPGHAAHEQVVAGIVRERAPLVLNTGDLVATGSEESAWQKYFEITAPLGAISPVVPAFGNHEAYRLGLGLPKAWALFGLTSVTPEPGYASFDWGGAHFVILDSNHLNQAQRDWLADDLAAAKSRHVRAIFTVCHDGPWSHGVHGGSRVMQTDFAPLLAAAGVDFMFGGHDHIYERGIGTTPKGTLPYAVVGGGGAPLYTPTCRVGPGEGETKALPRCPSSVAAVAKAYHYVVVEVGAQTLRLCAKLPDGSPLEPCFETRLRQAAPSARRPTPTPAPAPRWRGDFETGNLSQWSYLLNPRGLSTVDAPVVEGHHAARVEIQAGDLWPNGLNRVELQYKPPPETLAEGRRSCFAWSFFLPASLSATRHQIGYWESYPSYKQLMSVEVRAQAISFVTRMPSERVHWTAPAAVTPNVWHRIAMCTRWSTDPAVGSVDVWFDGQQVVEHGAARTLWDNPNFVQVGILRDVPGETEVMFVDAALEGPSSEAVRASDVAKR